MKHRRIVMWSRDYRVVARWGDDKRYQNATLEKLDGEDAMGVKRWVPVSADDAAGQRAAIVSMAEAASYRKVRAR